MKIKLALRKFNRRSVGGRNVWLIIFSLEKHGKMIILQCSAPCTLQKSHFRFSEASDSSSCLKWYFKWFLYKLLPFAKSIRNKRLEWAICCTNINLMIANDTWRSCSVEFMAFSSNLSPCSVHHGDLCCSRHCGKDLSEFAMSRELSIK